MLTPPEMLTSASLLRIHRLASFGHDLLMSIDEEGASYPASALDSASNLLPAGLQLGYQSSARGSTGYSTQQSKLDNAGLQMGFGSVFQRAASEDEASLQEALLGSKAGSRRRPPAIHIDESSCNSDAALKPAGMRDQHGAGVTAGASSSNGVGPMGSGNSGCGGGGAGGSFGVAPVSPSSTPSAGPSTGTNSKRLSHKSSMSSMGKGSSAAILRSSSTSSLLSGMMPGLAGNRSPLGASPYTSPSSAAFPSSNETSRWVFCAAWTVFWLHSLSGSSSGRPPSTLSVSH